MLSLRFVALGTFVCCASTALAQEARRSLDLTVNHVGISIGDSREVTGLRLNFRDTRLERVDGMNITIWPAAKSSNGAVRGIALGLPYTGGREIFGISAGVGIEAKENLSGISASLFGSGAGKSVRGIHVAGVGMGSGGDVSGIGVGGIGIGAGGSLHGLMVGGIGAGAGGSVRGIVIGGIGAAAGGSLEGIAIGGIGVGAAGNSRGLIIGGIGAGVGGDFDGIAIGGIGVGAGGTMRGLVIGGIGVGAQKIRGVALGGVGVGGADLHGLFLSPVSIKVTDNGVVRGLAVSAFNDARKGTQRGLMIGLVNIADKLHGVQVGVINIARGNPAGRRVLPIANWSFAR
jgi:hypothetical protein